MPLEENEFYDMVLKGEDTQCSDQWEEEITVISCICNVKCTLDNHNELCLECATTIENCKGIEEIVTCTCENKCSVDNIDTECEVCMESIESCLGEEEQIEAQLMSKEEIRRTWFNCNDEDWVGTCGDYEWNISVYEDLQWDSICSKVK